ncbi:MAG: hypothetical protein ACRENP_14110 [Longimicrobiales bacterium]
MLRKLLGAVVVLSACSGGGDAARTVEAEQAPPAERTRFTMEPFRGLHFLAGNRKGTMANGSLFFGSYHVYQLTRLPRR